MAVALDEIAESERVGDRLDDVYAYRGFELRNAYMRVVNERVAIMYQIVSVAPVVLLGLIAIVDHDVRADDLS